MKKLKFILTPLIIVVLGALLAFLMIKSKDNPKKIEKEEYITLVEVKNFKEWSGNTTILGSGFIQPENNVIVLPQITGKLIFVSKNMKTGGKVKKGEILFKIASKEYELRVDMAKSKITAAEIQLKMENEKAAVAQEEWELYTEGREDENPGELLLRKPQIENAQTALDSAKASLEVAKENLSRTDIKAPFTGFVDARFVSFGQVVSPGMKLATIVSKKAEVSVGIKSKDAKWISLPTKAKIFKDQKQGFIEGVVKRKSFTLNKRSKLVNFIVEFTPKSNNDFEFGSFVDVKITGNKVENVFKIPRNLVQNDKLYVAENNLLKIKKISVFRTEHDIVMIKGISENDLIITDELILPVEGSSLKTSFSTTVKKED